MESQPQNPEFRNNAENFHPCQLVLSLCILANFSCFYCCLLTFSKNTFMNPFRMSNGLYPDHDQHFVGPDLGPSCLQWLLVDDKSSLHAYQTLEC